MKAGFTSTSLRKYSVEAVVEAAALSGAAALEWGTDYHIRTEADALKARHLCDENGIISRSLGSYYRMGTENYAEWERLCALSEILGAEYIRTWLGGRGSDRTGEKEYSGLVEESLRMADIAAKHGAVISNECHHGTYNDTVQSSLRYLADTGGRVKTYYQSWYRDREGDFEKLSKLLPFVSDVHVSFSELSKFQTFHRKDTSFIPDIISSLAGADFGGFVLIEFTAGGKKEKLVEDVIKLRSMIDEAENISK